MTGRGRPPVGPRVNIRIPVEVIAALDAEAERLGVNRSELVRRILCEALTP